MRPVLLGAVAPPVTRVACEEPWRQLLLAFGLVGLLAWPGCGGDGRTSGRVMIEADSPATRGNRLSEAISLETGDGELAPILERGCALPCREVVTFGTAEDDQAEIVLYLFRGNGATTDGAVDIGAYELSGFPQSSDEEVEVTATFGADSSGVWIEADPGPDGGVSVRQLDAGRSLDFEALANDYPRLADERHYTARDGTELPVRTYGHDAPVDLILVHGSGAFNAYLSTLAAALADAGAAVVHTPDVRGHGASPERRGDIDYIDQLEDDLADLIADLRAAHPERKIVVGGHSSGGGLAVRLAGGEHADLVDGWLLFAPFLGHDAPTTRPNSGGWAKPRLERIIPLSMLNAIGITVFNGATVLEFDLPASRRSGRETGTYTFRMMSGFNPRSFSDDLPGLCLPTLVVVGSDDEAFIAEAFEPVFAAHAPDARVAIVPGAGHLGLVTQRDTASLAIAWLRTLAAGEAPGGCS